jgi:hypothetical protein
MVIDFEEPVMGITEQIQTYQVFVGKATELLDAVKLR